MRQRQRTITAGTTTVTFNGDAGSDRRRLLVQRNLAGFDHDALLSILEGEPVAVTFATRWEAMFIKHFVTVVLLAGRRRRRAEAAS
jgi:hypothetical protein